MTGVGCLVRDKMDQAFPLHFRILQVIKKVDAEKSWERNLEMGQHLELV